MQFIDFLRMYRTVCKLLLALEGTFLSRIDTYECVFVARAPCQPFEYFWKIPEEPFYAPAQDFRPPARMICAILAVDFDSLSLWNLGDRPISVFPAHPACLRVCLKDFRMDFYAFGLYSE